MKSQRERDDEKRRGRLADMQRQVKQGSLVIRQMTPEERERNPVQPPPGRRK